MKKKVMIMALTCTMAVGANAQIYSYDRGMRMPTRDLYDKDIMGMYLHAMAETAELRKENFQKYSNMAIEAYNNKQWNKAINYVNLALETQYANGLVYYIRGYAYESLGDYRAAKKDYKMGVKYDSEEAARALAALKEKTKK